MHYPDLIITQHGVFQHQRHNQANLFLSSNFFFFRANNLLKSFEKQTSMASTLGI